MNIFVSNLNYNATDDDLCKLFAEYGEVTSAKIIVNRMSGRSRGYGFIEMSDDEAAKKAIAALADQDFMDRTLNVTEAKSRGEKDE